MNAPMAPQEAFARLTAEKAELQQIVIHQAAQARIEAGRYADLAAKLKVAESLLAKSGKRVEELEAEVDRLKPQPTAEAAAG